ncbi:hypothetical protein DFH08DRAFT_880630 [Mycena albidolilacea]|uniref:Uncharacterized protein n=1 Tax=Mycena albidolilacea TaxID=1033008 RepID=A0AAD6ZQB2_9AGAR|nr:hypothetical protein DFH08DRAFT_880630 [Mycena albidolilacea]
MLSMSRHWILPSPGLLTSLNSLWSGVVVGRWGNGARITPKLVKTAPDSAEPITSTAVRSPMLSTSYRRLHCQQLHAVHIGFKTIYKQA